MSEFAGRTPVELDGGSIFPPIGQFNYLLTLSPYGFYWFLLADEEAAWPTTHTPAPEPMPEYQTIVLRTCLADALASNRVSLERDILPAYLAKRRWFAMKDQTLRAARVASLVALPHAELELLLAEIETETQGGTARWLLPLAIAWEDRQTGPLPAQLALARVRRGARVGLLTDAFSLPEFASGVLAGLAGNAHSWRASLRTDLAHGGDRRPAGCRDEMAVGGAVEFLDDRRRCGDAEAVPARIGGAAP